MYSIGRIKVHLVIILAALNFKRSLEVWKFPFETFLETFLVSKLKGDAMYGKKTM